MVRVEPAPSVFAQAIDRSGYARGTLTPDPLLTADVPDLDSAPVLTHGDMGMGHGGHNGHAGHDMGGVDHSQHAGHDMGGMDGFGKVEAFLRKLDFNVDAVFDDWARVYVSEEELKKLQNAGFSAIRLPNDGPQMAELARIHAAEPLAGDVQGCGIELQGGGGR